MWGTVGTTKHGIFAEIQNTTNKISSSLLKAKATNSSLAGIYKPPRGGFLLQTQQRKIDETPVEDQQKRTNARRQNKYLKEATDSTEFVFSFASGGTGSFSSPAGK